jgi:hypothetical protein
MRRFGLALALLLVSLAVAAPTLADSLPILVGRGEVISGRGYSKWSVAWEQWSAALPRHAAPDNQSCISAGQRGPVWFLFGNAQPDEHVITRNCTVPAGRYLMLNLPSVTCSDAVRNDRFANTPRGLQRCARVFWHDIGDPHPRLVLDGTAITPPGYVVRTRAYAIHFPERNNVFGVRGQTHGMEAAAGFSAILRPLSPGTHKLVQGISYRGDINRVVIYRLTVG